MKVQKLTQDQIDQLKADAEQACTDGLQQFWDYINMNINPLETLPMSEEQEESQEFHDSTLDFFFDLVAEELKR